MRREDGGSTQRRGDQVRLRPADVGPRGVADVPVRELGRQVPRDGVQVLEGGATQQRLHGDYGWLAVL